MILLDTSALVKRYVAEAGSDRVIGQMQEDPQWAASVLARSEARVTLCHRGPEGTPGSPAQRRLSEDWDRFVTVPLDPACLALAEEIGCRLRVGTLDAIHLAAAVRLQGEARFLSFDRQQLEAAMALGLPIIAATA